MTPEKLFTQIQYKKSFLCIGLDSDYQKLPNCIKTENYPLFTFNTAIIKETHKFVIAYKLNIAFYEALGLEGWENLIKTVDYLSQNHPEILLIADAKRGDIGNSSKMYAKAFFEKMNFDAITVNPYMGIDSIKPFLEYKDKWVIILALTSNQGAEDFQLLQMDDRTYLYEKIINRTIKLPAQSNIMYVIGATKSTAFKHVRSLIPKHFLLVPGIGSQGGNLEEVSNAGLNSNCGMIVNSSRAIIFADDSENYAQIAGFKAKEIQARMEKLLKQHRIISS